MNYLHQGCAKQKTGYLYNFIILITFIRTLLGANVTMLIAGSYPL